MNILLIAYDNEHHVSYFPQGLAYISSVLLKLGCNVEIYNQDINHYSEEHLLKYINEREFDIIGTGVVAGYYQYRKLLKISKAINSCKNRDKFIYILGGHGPTPDPEFFLNKMSADIIVRGEGEDTIVDIVDYLKGNKKLKDIDGIAFKENNEVVVTKERKLIEDIDSISYPAYHLFPMDIYRLIRIPNCESTDFVMMMLSGRGCKFTCNFCYRMDKGLRIRKDENIVEEALFLKEKYNINYIMFTDELLMSSKERTVNLCDSFIKNKLNIKWWCNGRLNYASEDVLKKMKEAGCVFINYGIESYNDDILKGMKKSLTTKRIQEGVENTLKVGISPGLAMMFGNIGETREHLQNSVNFLLKYDDQAQLRTIRPLTPYPGTPLYYKSLQDGLIKDIEDFYENKCVNSDLPSVNFTDLSLDEYNKCLYDANYQLLQNYSEKKKLIYEKEIKDLYYNNNLFFKGFRRY